MLPGIQLITIYSLNVIYNLLVSYFLENDVYGGTICEAQYIQISCGGVDTGLAPRMTEVFYGRTSLNICVHGSGISMVIYVYTDLFSSYMCMIAPK